MKRSSITGMVYGEKGPSDRRALPAPLSESGSIALTLEEGEELRVSVGPGAGYAVYLIPRESGEILQKDWLASMTHPDHEPGKVHLPGPTPVEIGE